MTWLLCGGRDVASSRLQGYLIHEEFRRRGITSEILWEPPTRMGDLPVREERLALLADNITTSIVVIQKMRGRKVQALIPLLKERGIHAVYVECDYRPQKVAPLLCDEVVVTSSFLLDHFMEAGARCSLIPDPIEYLESHRDVTSRHRRRKAAQRIRLAWVGSKAHWGTLEPLRSLLARTDYRQTYELLTISDHPDAAVPWHIETVRAHILSCDIGVVPTSAGDAAKAKSHNRVTLFMGLGIPVIAGSIPAYRSLIQDGSNGYIADSPNQWEQALGHLRLAEDRLRVALTALEGTVPAFALDNVADAWLRVFRRLDPSIGSAPNTCQQATATGSERARHRARLSTEVSLFYLREALLKWRWDIIFRQGPSVVRALLSSPRST